MAQTSTQLTEYPPSISHSSKYISATEAAPVLASFLAYSRKAPHLHPDAWLLSEGVRHGPKSGPNGGIAMHHLRRIEVGLRGEALEAETKEELRAQFGEEVVPLEGGHDVVMSENEEDTKPGDDTRLDAVIEQGEKQRKEKAAAPVQEESEKKKRKREKKERIEREKANKRKLDEAEGEDEKTQEELSVAAAEEKLRKKAKKDHAAEPEFEVKKESSPPASEKKKKKRDKKAAKVKNEDDDADSKVKLEEVPVKDDEWQSREEYERSQKPIEGEVGDRDPAAGQDAAPPVIVKHDAKGNIEVPKKPKTDAEKAERKAARKARRAEEKAQKLKDG